MFSSNLAVVSASPSVVDSPSGTFNSGTPPTVFLVSRALGGGAVLSAISAAEKLTLSLKLSVCRFSFLTNDQKSLISFRSWDVSLAGRSVSTAYTINLWLAVCDGIVEGVMVIDLKSRGPITPALGLTM